MRIIHLSDLHIQARPEASEDHYAVLLRDHLLALAASHEGESILVVITGDLVEDGIERQYRWLSNTFLEPLRARFPVVCVPGNHDYAHAGAVFRERAPGLFRRYVYDPAHDFPFAHVDEPSGVAVIGLDSADTQGRTWLAQGVVDGEQLSRLDGLLERYRHYVRIVLVHHHPFHRYGGRAFKESNAFHRTVSGRADVVLFGHKHRHGAYYNCHGVPYWLAAGKSTKPKRGNIFRYWGIQIDESRNVQVSSGEAPLLTTPGIEPRGLNRTP